MGPVAQKLLKELRKAKAGVVDLTAFREAKKLKSEIEADPELEGLPANHQAWMRVFKVLAGLAHALLGMHALRKLAQRVDDADAEYMPGGPPQSPILDSVFMSWWMADVPVGPARETVCSIIADLGAAMGMQRELIECARLFARSRMGVYRVTSLEPHRVQLDELLTGARVCARVPDDMSEGGDLWLTRLLPPIVPGDSDWVVWTTPYWLGGRAQEAEWRQYCERAIAGAAAGDRGERLARHFKAQDDPRRWTEYIMNGYAGVTETEGAIALAGVPDRPQTLPHHPEYDPSAEKAGIEQSPLQRLRVRLQRIADEHGFAPPADPGAQPGASFADARRIMGLAYRMYGQLDAEGRSAVDLLLQDAAGLPIDELRELTAIAAGWFSAFEILHIRVDEGMELRDVFGGRKLWVSECSATRQVELGDVLVGWVMVAGERVTLEGGLCHVPAHLSDAFISGLRATKKELERKHRSMSATKRQGLLAQRAVPLLEEVFAAAPPPMLLNHDGDEIVFSTARYDVVDVPAAKRALAACFEQGTDGSYHHAEGGVSVAMLELKGRALRVDCNSKQRLARMKAKLDEVLGSAAKHRADHYEAPRTGKDGPPRAAAPAIELPPEAQAQVRAVMVQHMRAWLDEPVPLLGGKTPRQAARSERGRETVTHMLLRQQQIYESGPLPPIDLSEIWAELGLTPRA